MKQYFIKFETHQSIPGSCDTISRIKSCIISVNDDVVLISVDEIKGFISEETGCYMGEICEIISISKL